MTLVILAAGMGSRYGGLKQVDSITSEGEFIIDFSVYDAVQCGFDKIVFVIKEENLDIFRQTIGSRIEDKIKVEYAFQKLSEIPRGFSVPEGREKPWGTGQAVLAARGLVKESFAVINADDFYGRDAYRLLASHLKKASDGSAEYAMIGYILENTLTENGTVSRGICTVDGRGMLQRVVEQTAIRKEEDRAVCGDVEIPLDSIASMNCWGFTPDIFEKLEILTDAAKYDASCTSSGSERGQGGNVGTAVNCGICHSWSADGRCISLLKVLYTNYCEYDW